MATGPNGLALGQLQTAEGTQSFLIDPSGRAVVVTPDEVSGLLQGGYKAPTEAQQAWTQNELAHRNPGFYPTLDQIRGGYTPTSPRSPAPSTAKPPTSATAAAPARDFRSEARLLYSWMPPALLEVFVDAWAKYGDPVLAMQAIRGDNRYEQFFPGNRREDGTVILPEGEYLSTMEGYDREIASFGLDPTNYGQRKVQALKNGRSPRELGASIGKMYAGIVTKGDTYRAFYAQKYGNGNLSDMALLDAALDGSISPYEAERRVRAAQVGGAAKLYGFDITRQEAERLDSFGLDDAAARTLYSKAATELPTLRALATRFNDPDDPLTVDDFADALVLNDPEELQQIGRLYARDRSQFAGGGSGLFAVDREGGQAGILAR